MTRGTGGGQQIPVDTVVTGDVFYMRSPAFARTLARGKEWIKLDLAKLRAGSAASTSAAC